LPASRHFYVRLYANEAVAVKLATSSKEGNYRVAQKLARQNQVYSLIVFQTLWRCRLSRIQGGPQSGAFFYALALRQILTNIHIFSLSELGKIGIVIVLSLKIPPHLKCVAIYYLVKCQCLKATIVNKTSVTTHF